VTVELTPLNLDEIKANTLDFQVAMNTHSVELGLDLAKLAVLQVAANAIAAQTWQSPSGGGHHVAGTLIFPGVNATGKPVLDGATGFSVVIRNLAGISERHFTWDLGQTGAAAGSMVGMATSSAVTHTMSLDQGGSGAEGAGGAIASTTFMSGDRKEQMG